MFNIISIFQERNADYFSQYVTENFAEYVRRKRRSHVHGNHLEIQALAEMYSRPVHIYSYSSEPINIFQHIPQSESEISIPIRLCYHRGVHYNSLVRSVFSALIGREVHSVAMPAVLYLKEPARASKAPN